MYSYSYADEIYDYAYNSYPQFINAKELSRAILNAKRKPADRGYTWNDCDYDDDDYYDTDEYETEPVWHYWYLFARDIKGADIELLQDAIIGLENYEYIYLFARDVPGANIDLLQNAMKNADYWDLCKFARIPGVNLELLQEYLNEEIKIGPECDILELFDYVREFAQICGVNVKKMIADIEEISKYSSEYYADRLHNELIVSLKEIEEEKERVRALLDGRTIGEIDNNSYVKKMRHELINELKQIRDIKNQENVAFSKNHK